jgi:hypothetical protein
MQYKNTSLRFVPSFYTRLNEMCALYQEKTGKTISQTDLVQSYLLLPEDKIMSVVSANHAEVLSIKASVKSEMKEAKKVEVARKLIKTLSKEEREALLEDLKA